MKRFLTISVALLLLMASTQAAIASTGMGGRAMGMGGAFTAVADDGIAAYWNPAGLTQIKFGLTPTFGGVGNWDGISDLMEKIEKLKNPDSFDKLGDLGIKKTGVLTNLGAGLNFRGFALNIYTEPNIDTTGLNRKNGDLNGSIPLVISLSLAREFTDLISVGANIKNVSLIRANAEYQMEGIQLKYMGIPTNITAPYGEIDYGLGTGFALDLGGLFKVSDRIRAGVVLRNISLGGIKLKGERSKTDLDYLQRRLDTMTPEELEEAIDDGSVDVMLTTEEYTEAYQLPTVLALGGALKLPVTKTLIAADFEIPFSGKEKSSLHVGVEQPIFGLIFLRAGGYTADDGLRITGGLGGKLGPLVLDLAAVKGKEHSGYFLTGGLKF